MPLTGLLQVGQKCHAAMNRPPEINIHYPFKIFNACVFQATVHCHTGIIDYNIDLPKSLRHLVGVFVERLPVGYIQSSGMNLDIKCLQHTLRRLQLLFINVGDRQLAAFCRQCERNSPADTGAGASDYRNFFIEVLQFGTPLSIDDCEKSR